MRYVSLDYIMEEYYSSPIPGENLSEAEAKEYIWKVYASVGLKKQYILNKETIDVVGGKAYLPRNMEKLHQITEGESEFPMIVDPRLRKELSYNIIDNVVYTSFDEGSLNVEYYMFPVDSNNNPVVIDDIHFIDAVLSFIKYKLAESSWLKNKLTRDKFEYFKYQKIYHMKAAKASLSMPKTVDEKRTVGQAIMGTLPTKDFRRKAKSSKYGVITDEYIVR